MTERTPIT